MIDKFCCYLTKKIKNEIPELDEERLEVINYGINLIIGEIPKILLLFVVGFIIGRGYEMLFAFFTLLPLKSVAGGIHLKTHLGCFLCTNVLYLGTILLSTINYFTTPIAKFVTIFLVWVFGMFMIYLYAPADTESLPILRKSERKIKKILSYIFFSITLIAAIMVNNVMYSNILWIGALVQILTITRLAYIITNNKYGFETYNENGQTV